MIDKVVNKMFWKVLRLSLGTTKKVEEGIFHQDVFGYYDKLRNIIIFEDLKDYASIQEHIN